MATIGIVMSHMLSIYVATAGIVMKNMLSNNVKVYTSIDKPICSLQQSEVHHLDYVCRIVWTSFLFHFLCLPW